jgi:hypothetical protein
MSRESSADAATVRVIAIIPADTNVSIGGHLVAVAASERREISRAAK